MDGDVEKDAEDNDEEAQVLEKVIDFTLPYYEEPTSFVTHKPAPLPRFQLFFFVFDNSCNLIFYLQ